MKKTSVLVVMLLLCLGIVSATTVETNWDGSGFLSVDTVADDDHQSYFETYGSAIEGNFNAEDKNDNPYNYGVDTVTSYVKARAYNGYSIYQADRTDSKTSYGNAGQRLYAEMFSDENAEMAIGVSSNYASMKSCTYGKQKTTSGNNFEASGNNFGVYHEILDGDQDGASFELVGSGSVEIDTMSSELNGNNFKLGKGCGCYTNADVSATGYGVWKQTAHADNAIVTDNGLDIGGDSSDDSATYEVTVSYSGHFTQDNFALTGN